MAVTIDDLVTPLPADGSAVRDDLIYFAGLLGLTIPVVPSNAGYQLVSMLGRWGTRIWNSYAIPAIRAQFGDLAAGDWATLFWRGRGVDRNDASFASGPVTFENRTLSFQDISAVGAVQVTAGGVTYTSMGPPPGSTGTLNPWSGSGPYPQTVLTMQAGVAGTTGNVLPNALPVYPASLSSGPAGVYVVSNPLLLGSNQESDAALLARGRASVALGTPFAPVDKITAIVLSTKLPGPPPTPVATNRTRLVPGNGDLTVYCATASGPTPGDTMTPGSEIYEINARVQFLCGVPGLILLLAPASQLNVMLGTITLFVTAKSNITAAQATVWANAALTLWTSTIVQIGGFRSVAGGQGWIFANEALDIAKSRVNPSYPLQWLPETLYNIGANVSNLGQTFTATAPGVSGSIGPTGDGGTDGGSGLVWAPTTLTGTGAQFDRAPGVFDASMTFSDTMVDVDQVPVFSWSIAVSIVDQGT